MRIVDGSVQRDTSVDGQRISFLTRDVKEADEVFAKWKDKPLKVTIEPQRGKRSLDANAYMWVLCEKIADAIMSTREKVYRRAIKECGVFTDMAIQVKALGDFQRAWEKNGIGWFTDVFDSKLEGCKKIRVYYGSSTYDTKEMSRLIDYVVDEAKGLGIETMTPEQVQELVERWNV